MSKKFELEWWHIALAIGAIVLLSNQTPTQPQGLPVLIPAVAVAGPSVFIVIATLAAYFLIFGGGEAIKWLLIIGFAFYVFTAGLFGSNFVMMLLFFGFLAFVINALFGGKKR